MLPIESTNTIREVPPFIEPPCRVFPDVFCWSWHVSVLELQPGLVTGLPQNLPYSADAQPKTAGDGGERVPSAQIPKIIQILSSHTK